MEHSPGERELLTLREYADSVVPELREQLGVAAGTRFYAEKFEHAELTPEEVQAPEDLRQFPLTRKEELRESQRRAPPFGEHQACDREAIARVYTTSGTTGTPTFVGLTESDLDVWAEAGARAARTAGLGRGDIVVGVLAGGPFAGAVTYDGHRAAGATIAPVGPGETDRVVALFENDCGSALLGTPSYAEYLLEQLREREIEPTTLGIERMLLGGEPGTQQVRESLESAFDCQVTESMGISDVCISVWGECRERQGMHFTGQGATVPELIDPETGGVIDWEPGARGELVYTSLNRECVPVVRFRSRDRVEVLGTDCACGRQTPRIRCLGRTDDVFVVRGVTVFPSAVKDVVSDIQGTTGQLRIHLPEGSHAVDAPVPITVERDHATAVDPETLVSRVETALADRLSFGAEVDVVAAGALDRSEYKMQLVERR